MEYGLTGVDADALMGVRCLPVAQFVDLLTEADPNPDEEAPIGDLLTTIIDQHRGELETLGRRASWERRWRRYHAEVAHWRAQPECLKEGRWREKPMTTSQRAFVQITATALGVVAPLDLTNGTAADRLDSHDAPQRLRALVHAVLRSESVETRVRISLGGAAPLYRDAPEASAARP